jgi:hypothetical protein
VAWTEKKGSGSGKNITKWESMGTELVGVFLGVFEAKDKQGKTFENIRVKQDGNLGETDAYYTSDLQDKLADVAVGSRVQIVYTGKVTTNGGRTVKKFRVLVDDGAAAPATPAGEPMLSEYETLAAKLQEKDPKNAGATLAALKQLYKDEGARTQALREAMKQQGVA